MTVEAADDEQACKDEDDVEHKEPICEQRVDAKHDKNDGIVAREVAQVVVDTGLGLNKVGGLGDTLEVEELGDGTQVGEAAAERTSAEA